MNEETLISEMNDETLIWAWIFAIASVSSWVLGDRSVFGKTLVLRSGIFWRIFRWAGLVLFLLAVTIEKQSNGNGIYPLLALFGAFVMFIGNARKRVKSEIKRRQESGAEKDTTEQTAAAPESQCPS